MTPNIVTFHYTLRDASGRMIDMSIGGEPVTYMEGAGQIIDGLEEKLHGLPAGTKTIAAVPATKAYGERDEALMHRVKRALLPVDGEVKIGDQFRTSPDPRAPIVTVAADEGDEVVLDANHPLAGVDLEFHVEIVSAREATVDELAQAAAARAQRCSGGGCGCSGKRGRDGCDGDCDCDGHGKSCNCDADDDSNDNSDESAG